MGKKLGGGGSLWISLKELAEEFRVPGKRVERE
jgi:hypothetical protein